MAFRKRAETLQITSESNDFEVKVLSFQCHDETSLGKHHKKWNWTIDIGESKQEWELKVDEAIVGNKTLHFAIDGEDVFNGKMQEDFEHQLPVRGTIPLDKPYEVKSIDNSSDQWYSATLIAARPDGLYDAKVIRPADRKEMHYPLVEANHIRDPFTKELVYVPSTMVRLAVKKEYALLPELTISGNPFTKYFCVPVCNGGKHPAEISLTVSKDRTNVIADVGHGKLKEALDAMKPGCNIRAKACKKAKLNCEWVVQIGAFDEHKILAERKSKSSKKVTVSIDGHHVVGGRCADLGSDVWYADITVQGELALKYQLHKTNADGEAMQETSLTTKNLVRSSTIRVTIPDICNFETAMLECDEVKFSDLTRYKKSTPEYMINNSLETFEMTHGISVPFGGSLQTLEMTHDMVAPGSTSDFARFIPREEHEMDNESSASGFTSDFVKLFPRGIPDFTNLVPCLSLTTFNDHQHHRIDKMNSHIIEVN